MIEAQKTLTFADHALKAVSKGVEWAGSECFQQVVAVGSTPNYLERRFAHGIERKPEKPLVMSAA